MEAGRQLTLGAIIAAVHAVLTILFIGVWFRHQSGWSEQTIMGVNHRILSVTIAIIATALMQEPSAFCGTAEFQPTMANKNQPPGKAPEGMVWIPGGEFSMGAAVNGEGSHETPMASNDSQPVHRVYVDGFLMDATLVTNAQFEKFVRATGYVTIAERTPTKEEFPTAPEEILWRAQSYLRRRITKFRSTIIINGEAT
jgi:formylglycine-generating enzyme required for sulfatase activity